MLDLTPSLQYTAIASLSPIAVRFDRTPLPPNRPALEMSGCQRWANIWMSTLLAMICLMIEIVI
eukprot:4382206-Prymnesium_polylepis.1